MKVKFLKILFCGYYKYFESDIQTNILEQFKIIYSIIPKNLIKRTNNEEKQRKQNK